MLVLVLVLVQRQRPLPLPVPVLGMAMAMAESELLLQFEAGALDMTDSRVRFKVDKAKRVEARRTHRRAEEG